MNANKGESIMPKNRVVSAASRRRVIHAISTFDDTTSEARVRFEGIAARPNPDLDRVHEAIAESERPDRSIIINAR